MRRRCGGVRRTRGGGDSEGEEGDGREKQPGCQDSKSCLSFRASVSLFPGSHAGTVFAQMRVYIYTHTHTHACAHTRTHAHAQNTHFSHSINASWMLEISLFILCHSLIRFHRHSNPIPSTFFSLFLPRSHSLPHTARPSGCFLGNSCFLFVTEEARAGVMVAVSAAAAH